MRKRYSFVILCTLGITLLSLMIFPPVQVLSSSRELNVCLDGCEFGNIQGAIDEAAPGDVVRVQGGTYVENLQIKKGITLSGEENEKVIVQAKARGYPVLIINAPSDDEVIVRDLNLVVDKETECAKKKDDICLTSGVLIMGESSAKISYLNISDMDFVGFFLIESSQATIENSSVSYDTSTSTLCVGLQATGSSRMSLNNTIFSGGSLGILLADSSTATITNTTMMRHISSLYLADESQVTVEDSAISGSGDGVSLLGSSRGSISSSSVSQCWGTGIELEDSAHIILSDLNAEENKVAGLTLAADSYANVERCTFARNGDGVALSGGASLAISNSNVVDNSGWGIWSEDDFEGTIKVLKNNQITGNEKGDMRDSS